MKSIRTNSKLIKILIKLFFICLLASCNSTMNKLTNKALLENKSLLDVDFMHVFDIDESQIYDSLYLNNLLEQNHKIQIELYNLYDTLLNFKGILIDEKQDSKKSLREEYDEKIRGVDESKKEVRERIDHSKKVNDKIENYLRKN